MTATIVAMRSVPETQADVRSLKAIARFCCLGLVVSLCLMNFGMDLSAGWL
jgi:hypothetical protein